MRRVKGLPNENYRERKEAIERALKAAYEGDLIFTEADQAFIDQLDKGAK